MKKFIISALIVIFVVPALLLALILALLFPPYSYEGDHPELYTVAVNSVFGIWGYLSNGEVLYDPNIKIVETDDYGRVLFFYNEYYDDVLPREPYYGMAYVILQAAQDGTVYYYRDECCALYFGTSEDNEDSSRPADEAMLEDLKARNDWNLPLDLSKCQSSPYLEEKPEGKLRIHDHQFDKLIHQYSKENGYRGTDDRTYKGSIFCCADDYGRELHYVYAMRADPDGAGKTIYSNFRYAIIFNPDGTYSTESIVEIPTPPDSVDLIAALKQQNHWNQPYKEEK